MEPGSSGENPADSRCLKQGGLREETPGEEARCGEGNAVMLRRRGGDEGTPEKMKVECEEDGNAENQIKTVDEEDDGKYEEELDPRIQACCKIENIKLTTLVIF